MDETVLATIWEETRSLRPIILAAQAEGDALRRLPDSVAKAFVERDVNRLLLPEDLGGRGIDPQTQFDLIEEVSSYDGSAGWSYAISSASGIVGGAFEPGKAREFFSSPEQGMAGAGAPQGRAVSVEGGYRLTGRFAWVSGIHHATWMVAGLFVFDGEEQRLGPTGMPVIVHALLRRNEINILDTWRVGGMRGTGSTEVEIDDVFVPQDRIFSLIGAQPKHPSPLYRLPPSFFGFGLSAVPLGIARGAVEALKDLAARKQGKPPRPGLGDRQHTHYAVGKAEALADTGRMALKDAFAEMWREVCEDGQATMTSRAKLRRIMVHAVDSAVEAVQLCYHAAGGSALFEEERFERALRDVNAAAGHLVMQREMMEDAGRVALGMPPLLPNF